MKKIGKLTEARMVIPEEPKVYPLVSDKNFKGTVVISENKMKGYPEKGIKGGTKAAAKEFAKRKKGKLEEELPMNRRGRITQPGPAPKVDPGTYQTYNSMTDAKDPNWIQGAEKDIKRRGTEGKCTPITKPGCTGKAKALAKTFKKMAKKRDAEIVSNKEKAAMKEGSMGAKRLGRVEKALQKKHDKATDASWSQDDATREKGFQDRDKLRKKINQTAFKQGVKKSQGASRAQQTGGDPRDN